MAATIPAATDPQLTGPTINGAAESHMRMHGRFLRAADNLIAWGGDPTGVTSSSTALQALIDSVPASGSAGVPVQTILVPEGTYSIDTQINIYQKGLIMRGTGIGNPTNYATPGKGTTFQWTGAAGGCMFNIRDSMWIVFEDMLVLGNLTNIPNDLFYFQNAGGTLGTNEMIFMNRMQLGAHFWSNPVTWNAGPAAPTAVNAIRFGGNSGNNDQFHLSDVEIRQVNNGIVISNTQSVWGLLENVFFDNCRNSGAGVGLTTSSSIDCQNLTFNHNDIDMSIASTAHVNVFGFHDEGSTQYAVLTGAGSVLNVWGGHLLFHSGLTANIFDHQACYNGGGIKLDGVFLDAVSGTITGKVVKARSDAGAGSGGFVHLMHCRGNADLAGLDCVNAATSTFMDVQFIGNGKFINRQLGSAETLSTTVPSFTFKSGDFIVGSTALAASATTGFLRIPSIPHPSGTPTTESSTVPMAWCTTHQKLISYSGTTWRHATYEQFVAGTNVTNGSGTSSTSGTSFVTSSVSPSSDKLLLLAVTNGKTVGAAGASAVSGCGLTWVEVAHTADYGTPAKRTTLFRALGTVTPGALTISFSPAEDQCLWSLAEFDGILTTGTAGADAIVQSGTTTVSAVTTGTVTLGAFADSGNGTYVCAGIGGVQTPAVGSGFTMLATGQLSGGGFNTARATEWKSTADTGADISWDVSGAAGIIAVEIQKAS